MLEQLAGVAALGGAFGVGIGALVRDQVVAIVGVLVMGFAVEPALVAAGAQGRPLRPVRSAAGGGAGPRPGDVGTPEDVDLPAAAVAVLLRYRDLE